MTLCDECDNESTLRCSGCGSSWYCSKECQKKAWALHKILCKSVKDFQDRPEAEGPDEKYTRAIYFHPDEGAPRFVWLKTMTKDGEYGHPCLTACPGALAANNEKETESGEEIGMTDMKIRHNHALARRLPYNLFLSYRENFLHDGSTHNMAIDKIIDPNSPHLHAWRGPMIAYGTDAFDDVPFSQDPSYSQDLGPSDLRIMAHKLNTYYFKYAVGPTIEDIKQELRSVVSVRINCDGDVEFEGRPRYEPMELPAYCSFFHAATDISEHIELPIVVQRIPGSIRKWGTRANTRSSPYTNTGATFLHIGCKPERKEWGLNFGLAPLEWQDSVCSVVVMRKDKKALLPEHVDALVEYHQKYLMEFFQHESETTYGGTEDEVQQGKARIMNEITKDKFEEYYVAWKSKQTDEVKKQQISPYDV
ncbi:hypothetical protein J4E81_010661 [Alternaria sp. BMP 2799]|nr:hypothetical protein J4E81_010661 [Alternaria sp. BMP 2799]